MAHNKRTEKGLFHHRLAQAGMLFFFAGACLVLLTINLKSLSRYTQLLYLLAAIVASMGGIFWGATIRTIIIQQETARQKFPLFLLVLSAFGPYLIRGSGVRLEQATIYILFFLFILFEIKAKKVLNVRIDSYLFIVLFSSILLLILGTVHSITLFTSNTPSLSYVIRGRAHFGVIGTPYSILSGFDTYFLPIAVIAIVMYSALSNRWRNAEIIAALKSVSSVICVTLAINAIIAILQNFVNLSPILSYFWSSDTGFAVGLRASEKARLTGIINQPVEAGSLYTVGILLWIYRWRSSEGKELRNILILALLLIGGVLSLSKAFIYVGVLIATIHLIISSRKVDIGQLLKLTGVVVLCSLFILPTFFNYWAGWEMLMDKLNLASVDDVMYTVTAGRLDSKGFGDAQVLLTKSLQERPVFGQGFALSVPADTAYTSIILRTGLVGFTFYLGIWIPLLLRALDISRWNGYKSEMVLYWMLLTSAGVIGIGGSPLHMNRIATINWLIISLLLLINGSHTKLHGSN